MNSSMRTGKKHKSNVLNKQGISSLSIQRRLRSGVTNPVELKILAEQHECVQQIITELINAASAEL